MCAAIVTSEMYDLISHLEMRNRIWMHLRIFPLLTGSVPGTCASGRCLNDSKLFDLFGRKG